MISTLIGKSLGYRRFRGNTLVHERQNLLDQRICGKPVLRAEDWNRAVLNEFVRPSDANNRRMDSLRIEMLHHGTTETIMQDVILQRANNFHAAREKFQGSGVDRLDPSRVNQRDGN